MKNIIVKRLVLSMGFVVTLLLLYLYSIMIFLPKNINDLGGTKYYNFVGFKAEAKNSIQVVMCGNSDVQHGFSPMEIYNSIGVTGYARGGGNQSAQVVEDDLKDIFKRQSPKVVMVDADCLFFKNEKWHGTNTQKLMPLVAPISLHARWKELTFKDFVTFPKPKKDVFKGCLPYNDVYNFELSENYMQNPTAAPAQLEESVLKNFKNIVEICKKHNAQLVLSCLPTPISWDNSKSNRIALLADEYNLPFLDMNLPNIGLNLNYSTAFKDCGNHLNFAGACTVSNFIADYLKQNFQNFNLEDYRNVEKYSSWNSDLVAYNQQKSLWM